MILPASFVNISGKRQIVAYILLACHRLTVFLVGLTVDSIGNLVGCHAAISFTITYTIASLSSSFIPLFFNPYHQYGSNVIPVLRWCLPAERCDATWRSIPAAQQPVACWARKTGYHPASVCLLTSFSVAGASLFATKSSACFRIVGNPFPFVSCLAWTDGIARKSDFANLSIRQVMLFLISGTLSCSSSSWNNDGYMYFCWHHYLFFYNF